MDLNPFTNSFQMMTTKQHEALRNRYIAQFA